MVEDDKSLEEHLKNLITVTYNGSSPMKRAATIGNVPLSKFAVSCLNVTIFRHSNNKRPELELEL